ncbi:MAG: hypothetical protein AOA65_2066 [Candidatus Bathyarchaeota archaeon BA1]|nr:MAG: hypothetical protein AOA65_2066 [Candidatus Bathyarchaeota archaeon BA1]
MDGDTLISRENLVFFVFGYEHPGGLVFSYLKYIPSGLRSCFPLPFLRRCWRLGDAELVRSEKLYTALNFQRLMEAFRNRFPDYVYFCPYRRKEVISVPLNLIKRVYVPKECLQRLSKRKRKDRLQKLALELINLLSTESGVLLEDFGIHGSIALNMHTMESDIDLVVRGSRNFRILEKAINKLVDEGTLSYVFTKRLDRVRRHRGRYKNTIFVYNAVRRLEEITSRYGDHRYHPVKPVSFSCQIIDDGEAMFRPAIYQITNYQPLDPASELTEDEIPTVMVSMIGYYRNVARRGDTVKASGMLERVENLESGRAHHQVVIGTGTRGDEYIWPL